MKNLFLLFAVTLVFGLTSCKKEELEPETPPQAQTTTGNSTTTSNNTGTGNTNNYTPLLTADGDTVDYSSPLYSIVNKTYVIWEINNVVYDWGRTVVFTDYITSTDKYEIRGVSQSGHEWHPIDKAGTKFTYRWLEMDIVNTSDSELIISNYDSISGDVLLTFTGTQTTKVDSILLILK